MFGGAVVIGLMSLARSAPQLVLLRALQGMLTGHVAAANTLVASTAPADRVGYAMGLPADGHLRREFRRPPAGRLHRRPTGLPGHLSDDQRASCWRAG